MVDFWSTCEFEGGVLVRCMSTFPKGILEVQKGEMRERGLAPCEPGERESVCVYVCMYIHTGVG